MKMLFIAVLSGVVLLGPNERAVAQISSGPTLTTDRSVATSNSSQQCLRQASDTPPQAGTSNEVCGFYSLDVPSGHGGATHPYEAVALYANAVTNDNNSGGLSAYDTGAFDGHITFGAGCVTCRGFGPHGLGLVPGGADGSMSIMEAEVDNNGGEQPSIDTATQKLSFHATCIGKKRCTAMLSSDAYSPFFMGLVVRTQDIVAGGPAFGVLGGGTDAAHLTGGVYADGHAIALGSSVVWGRAGATRLVDFATGTLAGALSPRWTEGADNAAETGSDAGSNFIIERYSDAGRALDAPLSIQRSTGVATFAHAVVFASIARPAQTTFADLRRIDPDPAVGDYLVISDAAACAANSPVTTGGGTGHACAVIYNGAAEPWIALVSH